MSYDRELLSFAIMPKNAASQTALNLAAAAGQWAGFAIMTPINIRRLTFLVTTATTFGLVAPQVVAKRYPTYGSSSGSSAIGTLTIPNAAVVGSVYYKDVSYFRLHPGDELALLIGVQGTDGGTAAGAGFFGFVAEMDPEYAGNDSDLIASA